MGRPAGRYLSSDREIFVVRQGEISRMSGSNFVIQAVECKKNQLEPKENR